MYPHLRENYKQIIGRYKEIKAVMPAPRDPHPAEEKGDRHAGENRFIKENGA